MKQSVLLSPPEVCSVTSSVDWTRGVNPDWDFVGPSIKPMGADSF